MPTELARGPWDANAQHGGAAAAILGRAVERFEPDARPRGRADHLRAPAAGAARTPLTITTAMARPGKRVQLVTARCARTTSRSYARPRCACCPFPPEVPDDARPAGPPPPHAERRRRRVDRLIAQERPTNFSDAFELRLAERRAVRNAGPVHDVVPAARAGGRGGGAVTAPAGARRRRLRERHQRCPRLRALRLHQPRPDRVPAPAARGSGSASMRPRGWSPGWRVTPRARSTTSTVGSAGPCRRCTWRPADRWPSPTTTCSGPRFRSGWRPGAAGRPAAPHDARRGRGPGPPARARAGRCAR